MSLSYKLLSKVGAGTYGEVFKAIHIKSGKTVAIKVCKLLKNTSDVVIQK